MSHIGGGKAYQPKNYDKFQEKKKADKKEGNDKLQLRSKKQYNFQKNKIDSSIFGLYDREGNKVTLDDGTTLKF